MKRDFIVHLVIVAMIIMVLAISSGAYFTIKKAKPIIFQIWDVTTKKLLYNFAIPLGIGGLFCAGLLYHGLHGLLSPATLIFYGLALFNAGNYTFQTLNI